MKSTRTRNRRRGAQCRRFGLAFTVLALAALASAPALVAQEAPLKIAVVDLEYIVANSPGGKALQGQLASFSEEVNAELQSRRQAAAALATQLAQGQNTLSPERLTALQKELDTTNTGIKRYQEDKQKEGQQMQADGLREIEEQLKPVFEAITAERGYDLILNNVPGVIVMAGPRADITQAVIDRLSASGGP